MLRSAHKIGGRAFAVVVWIMGLATIVAMTVILVFIQTQPIDRNWVALAQIIGGYFVMVGIVGAASQAGNAAERLPGVRRFEGQYRGHGDDRRAGDSRELEEK